MGITTSTAVNREQSLQRTAVLRLWYPHHLPLKDLLHTNSSQVSGSGYYQWLRCVLQLIFMHKDFSLQALRLLFNMNQGAMSRDDQATCFRSAFLIRTKSQRRLTHRKTGKGQTHRGLGYCLILLYFLLFLKNNKADLQTTPWLLNHLQVFYLKQPENSNTNF